MKQLMKKIILALLVCAGIAAGDPMLRAAEAAAKAPPPAPSLEQRIASLEAYVNNGDPTAPLKDKDGKIPDGLVRSEEHTSELQSQSNLVCRLLLEKKKTKIN